MVVTEPEDYTHSSRRPYSVRHEFDFNPSTPRLKSYNLQLGAMVGSERLLHRDIEGYDVVIADELRLKNLTEALKPETVGIRSNKAVKVVLDVIADAMGLEKKDLLTYFILKAFVDVWEEAPEPVKRYYRFKFKEIDEVYRVVRSIV